jgi:hypothetical protein
MTLKTGGIVCNILAGLDDLVEFNAEGSNFGCRQSGLIVFPL